KASGKRTTGQLKCWSREIVKPGGYAACASRVEDRFLRKFTEADDAAGCAVTGDADAIGTKIDTFVDDVVGDLTGSPAGALLGTSEAKECAARKLKAAAKASARKLKCHEKAATTGSLDGSCI